MIGRTLLAVLMMALLSACASRAAEETALAPITAFLEGFDPSHRSEAAFAQLNSLVIEQPRMAASAAIPLVEDERTETRYAAVYLLGLTAEEPHEVSALRGALDDGRLHIRTMAAGALAGLGEKRSIPVLIDGLADSAAVPFTDTRTDHIGLEALRAYTDQDLGPRAGDWREWWERERDNLEWNPEAGRFTS